MNVNLSRVLFILRSYKKRINSNHYRTEKDRDSRERR